MKAVKNKKEQSIVRFFVKGLIVIILCKHVFFSTDSIASGSMRSTYIEGDVVFSNVFAYGPQMPRTPLTVPLLSIWFPLYLDWIELPPWRSRPYAGIQHGDCAIFYPMQEVTSDGVIQEGETGNYTPVDQRTPLVKRIGGRPGDEVEIVNGENLLNGESDPYNSKRRWEIEVRLPRGYSVEQIQKNAEEYTKRHENSDGTITYRLIVTQKQRKFWGDKCPLVAKKYKGANLYEIEKVVVPYMGFKIPLNSDTHRLYIETIRNIAHNRRQKFECSVKDGEKHYAINGKPIRSFTFDDDCYFVEGDNLPGSSDSRSWGFVLRAHFKARAGRVLFNKYTIWDIKRWFLSPNVK